MIRLHRVSGRKILYAALSYCWGTLQPKATRTSNVIAYLEGIQLSSLPQTLQDAVIVTRKLGLQYLWVDSMCIIQDSDEDKAHEIGRMERIYSNAYVTISASSSVDCTAGFLSHRELNKEYIKIPFQTELKESTNLAIRSIRGPGDGYYGVIRSEPIESRAWTFQESFMSRRILIFSSHQLFWACGKVWGADGGNTPRFAYYQRPGVDPSVHSELVSSHHFMETPTALDWMQIVQLYSLRQLGDPLDKLPALSSIASYFARKLDDKYMAGLWYNCLPRMLCWRGNNGLTRVDAWRSPSWSFFSVDGQLHFEDYSTDLQDLECTILSCQTIPLSAQAPFGRISSAALTVQGRIIQVRPRESLPVDGSLVVRCTTSRLEIGTLFFDTLKSGDKVSLSPMVSTNHGDHFCAQPVWFLTLTAKSYRITSSGGGSVGAAIPDQMEWRPWGLALAKLPDGRYHRIGYIEGNNHAQRVFRKQQGETITIV
jgi:Heterokaryon incompatibility protein (HET)